MKISKIWVPAVALTATMNNYNNQVAASCESICMAGFVGCSRECSGLVIPWFIAGCEAGCSLALVGCLAICAANN